MKAIVFTKYGSLDNLKLAEIPKPTQATIKSWFKFMRHP